MFSVAPPEIKQNMDLILRKIEPCFLSLIKLLYSCNPVDKRHGIFMYLATGYIFEDLYCTV
jgi:hypothetical protein